MITHCEVRVGSTWETIGVEEARHGYKGYDLRCPECGGRVRAFPEYNTGVKAHFEHEQAHTGCSLTSYNFVPPKTAHPAALK
jgi:hypothetical protein